MQICSHRPIHRSSCRWTVPRTISVAMMASAYPKGGCAVSIPGWSPSSGTRLRVLDVFVVTKQTVYEPKLVGHVFGDTWTKLNWCPQWIVIYMCTQKKWTIHVNKLWFHSHCRLPEGLRRWRGWTPIVSPAAMWYEPIHLWPVCVQSNVLHSQTLALW